jgi:hypothetical protein
MAKSHISGNITARAAVRRLAADNESHYDTSIGYFMTYKVQDCKGPVPEPVQSPRLR